MLILTYEVQVHNKGMTLICINNLSIINIPIMAAVKYSMKDSGYSKTENKSCTINDCRTILLPCRGTAYEHQTGVHAGTNPYLKIKKIYKYILLNIFY